MEIKLLEIRDEGTHIDAISIALDGRSGETMRENYLIRHAGYGEPRCILLSVLNGGRILTYDANDWHREGRGRTMYAAHRWIEEHWDEIKSGAVVDVRYILGETDAPGITDADYPDAWLLVRAAP